MDLHSPTRPTGTAISVAQPTRNPALRGLRCLRCGDTQPARLHHTGCAPCRAEGWHVSLAADYATLDTRRAQLPYLGAQWSIGGRAMAATPLHYLPELAHELGVSSLSAKDESANPTGSHKDRMSVQGMAQALDMGAHTVVLASSGNAALSAAAYAHAVGLACEVATYAGLPLAFAQRLDHWGALSVPFDDGPARWAHVAARAKDAGIFPLTNYSLPALGSAPLAIEGYKVIADEVLAQGTPPDHVMVPTARGDLAWGLYRGFAEAVAGGRIRKLPKIWVVEPFARLSQVLAEPLSPMHLHSHHAGATAQFSTAGNTVTYLQWQAATESHGGALVVDDANARRARAKLQAHGITPELCAAAALAGVQQLVRRGDVSRTDHVMMMLTANASLDPSYPDPQP
jgi:threonine synthase